MPSIDAAAAAADAAAAAAATPKHDNPSHLPPPLHRPPQIIIVRESPCKHRSQLQQNSSEIARPARKQISTTKKHRSERNCNTSHTPAAATSSLHPSRSSAGLRALQNCLQGPPSSRISTVPVEIQRHAEYGFGVVFWWLFNTMKGSLWQHLYIDSMTFCIPLSFSSAQES